MHWGDDSDVAMIDVDTHPDRDPGLIPLRDVIRDGAMTGMWYCSIVCTWSRYNSPSCSSSPARSEGPGARQREMDSARTALARSCVRCLCNDTGVRLRPCFPGAATARASVLQPILRTERPHTSMGYGLAMACNHAELPGSASPRLPTPQAHTPLQRPSAAPPLLLCTCLQPSRCAQA